MLKDKQTGKMTWMGSELLQELREKKRTRLLRKCLRMLLGHIGRKLER